MLNAEALAKIPQAERDAFLASLSNEEALALLSSWRFWARPKQIAPEGDWTNWLILAGRGFGKTRAIAEWVIEKARAMPKSRGALVGRIASDVRDILVEGESGILACAPPDFMPTWMPSKRRLIFPNGARVTTFSADQPDVLRGPQHHWAACDELAAWRKAQDAWDNLMLGLRLGEHPQVAIATTPRPIPLVRELVKDPATHLTTGTTYENRGNLAPSFYSKIIAKYEGSRLGRQELLAQVLDDTPGALWTNAIIEKTRVSEAPEMTRIIVAIDPAVTSSEESSETGIIVTGIDKRGHGYVLDDATLRGTPSEWATAAIAAYEHWEADGIVAEVNNGGDMVQYTIEMTARSMGKRVPVKQVRASRGKQTRAEPVSTLYEQGMVHHVNNFPQLEDQMTTWTPEEKSPDRMDAMVWALTELMVEAKGASMMSVATTGLYGRGKRR